MNKGGRVVGMVVFALGILVLLLVFGLAYSMFTSPASDLLPLKNGPGSSHTAAGLGSAVAWIIVRIALLFVMTLAGSLIASRGIYLYLGCREVQRS